MIADDILIRKIVEERDKYAAAVAQGISPDWGDYRYRCGQINGMQIAINIIDGTLRQERERNE